MSKLVTREELESDLANQVVYTFFNGLSMKSKRWKKGGALIHKVRAIGYLAETGARSIAEDRTAITKESTFQDMRRLDEKMYEGTISLLYPYANAGIF